MRLFVALELPAEVQREVAERVRRERPSLPPARWVRPEAWHLTLSFLGETDPAAVAPLERALADAFGGGGAVGLEPEDRPYSPHLSLARAPEPWPRLAVERFVAATRQAFGPAFPVTEGLLIESQLGPGGPRYRVVRRFPLGRQVSTEAVGANGPGDAREER